MVKQTDERPNVELVDEGRPCTTIGTPISRLESGMETVPVKLKVWLKPGVIQRNQSGRKDRRSSLSMRMER